MKISHRILAGLALVAAAGASHATTVTLSTTLDLTQSGLGGGGFVSAGQGFSPDPFTPFALEVGDTLDFTIDFLGNQSLTLYGPDLIWAFIYADTVSQVTGTGTLDLFDSNGIAFLSSNPLVSTEGDVHYGQQFTSGDFNGGYPPVLTFYGLHFNGTITGYSGGVTSRLYSEPELVTNSVGAAVVPEPATWVLLMVGLGIAGASMRRRRAVVAA